MVNQWIVLDVQTGAMDGYYADREWAETAMRRAEARGAHSLVLCQVVAATGDAVISDAMFWNRHPMGYSGDHSRKPKQ